MATPSACNEANPGQIAKAVLMPGDPLRAKYVAEHYLENPVCFNSVRNMLGYGRLQGQADFRYGPRYGRAVHRAVYL